MQGKERFGEQRDEGEEEKEVQKMWGRRKRGKLAEEREVL